MWRRAIRIVLSLPFIVVSGLFGLYLVFGFFLVNPLSQKLLPWVGESKLAGRLSVEQVKFNPLTLEVTVNGLTLAEANGQLLASFEKLYLNIGVKGLFRFAWHIQDIRLTRPRSTFSVQPDGTFNWAVLMAKLDEDKKPPSGAKPRVLIDHIKIDDGDIEYIDTNRAGRPFKVVFRQFGMEVAGLSTLHNDQGSYRIDAKLPEQGGSLALKGDIVMNPLSSKGEILLEGIRLADLQHAIKNPRNFDISSGTLATGLHYRFAVVRDKTGADASSVQVSDANLSVQNFALTPRGSGEPVLELAEARIGNANIDLAERRVEIASVNLTGGRLSATRNVKGTLDWETLFPGDQEKTVPNPLPAIQPLPESSTSAQPATPWKIAVRGIRLADWAARFTDRGFAKPLTMSVDGFGMTAALTGEVGATPAIEVGSVNGAMGPVRVLSGEQEAAVLERAAFLDARLNPETSRLVIDSVELQGMRTSVVLDKNGNLNWTEILKAAQGVSAPAPDKSAVVKPIAKDKTRLEVQLGRFTLDGLQVGIIDQSIGTPVSLDVAKGFVKMNNLSLDMNKALPIEAGFNLMQGGNFKAAGTITPGKAMGKLDISLVGLSLSHLTPYINKFAKLNLHSGAVSTIGKLMFARTEAAMGVDFDGSFSVDDLAITEEATGNPFLGWKRLSSDSLGLKLSPNSLHMNELLAVNLFGKVIIYEDKSINLKRIMRNPEPEDVAKTEEAKQDKIERSDEKTAAFPFAAERLRITGADIEFADHSLKPKFGTRMHDLTGVITGLSNDPATLALVELDGKVDDFGLARVRGSIQPFKATDFTDLALTFRNLEMNNLTPYSGKFAGRKVDSGKLAVDLRYKVKQRELAGENKIVINKLKLGERTDSPEAMNLPLDLAIALLEDSDGIIDLDLPVSGNLDDPQFSYGKIIWKAIVNVLTKVVTSPFRALGRLMGISSERIEDVEFDFGSATLLPPEQVKLKEIGQALAKRPALTLTIAPAYDLRNDALAIQTLRIRRDVAKDMELNIAADQDPGPVDTANPRAQKVLEVLYDNRFNKQGGVKAIKAEYEKPGDSGKKIHAVMFERLTMQISVTDAELINMAQARGETVRQTLMKLGNVDAAKIIVDEPIKKDAEGKVVVCKVNLGAGNKPAPIPAPTTMP